MRYWTGVRVIDLLNLAGIKKEAKNIEFICIDGSYTQTLSLETLKVIPTAVVMSPKILALLMAVLFFARIGTALKDQGKT